MRHLNKLLTLLTDKQFWLSNLKTLALMLVIAASITFYQQRTMVSGPAPALSALTTQGDAVDLAAQNNTLPTLIYFWASWCSVCKTTSPAITNLAQENADGSADKAYNIISVALSSGSDEEINAYLTQQEYQFDAINDDNGQISKAWGVAVTPSLFIIDSSGDISFKSTGITSLWGMKVRLWLASL